ncbi:MAG: DegT/DnrJ/EryC1/StrS family aminotransferase [Flavobacteriales bacterium]|nr:DegT/DnrJ/EryC1/StrS family aminotransferase [Flavobacteriales bacterium]
MSSSSEPTPQPAPIGFAPPYIDEATIAAVERVLRSGWITTGPETASFEHDLARYAGADRVVCGGSWTGLAGVILDWFGVGPGDEVILPAYTYCATANVVLHRGATPVLVDLPAKSGQDGLNITWAQIEPLLTARTKVIMPVDIGGWPVPCAAWKANLMRWAASHGFTSDHPVQAQLGRPLLLSDAAHSLGATIDGAPVGRQADITVFSFHAVKNLTTAEGGAAALSLPAAFDAEAVYRTLRSHCLHGQSKDAAAKFNSAGSAAWRYDVTHPGFKCNMTDIQAAMGRVALERYPDDLAHRRALADRYDAGLAAINAVQRPQREDDGRRSADHLYIIRLSAHGQPYRDALMEALGAQGISTNVHFPPLPLLTAYADRGYDIADVPHAVAAFDTAISLPIHRHMDVADVDRVVAALSAALEALNLPPTS